MYGALKGEIFKVDDAAAAYGISRHHLGQVVHHLAKLGYLTTQRGRGGGIQVARKADQIRLGQLVRETEDQPILVECFDPATNTCRISASCRLKGILTEAMAAFYGTLDRYTLQDLISGPHRNRMQKVLRSL